MATVTLVDFEDIYTAIAEELKVQISDGTTIGRIKRDINMIYLNEVVPYKPRAWWWLEKTQDIQTYAKITTGTVTIADGSTTITFSSAPASSVAGYWFKVEGFQEVIKISSHTGGVATATLTSAWRRGAVTAEGYAIWRDYLALDSDMKEVTQITHEKMGRPMDSVNSAKFDEMRARLPDYNSHPTLFNVGDFDSSGNRVLRWFPSCDTTQHTMHVLGVQEATRLSADGDEPLMPVEDRIVLFYGGCSRAWARERNGTEVTRNWNMFMSKLTQMAGKSQNAPQTTEMGMDRDWLLNKRYRRLRRNRGPRWESD